MIAFSRSGMEERSQTLSLIKKGNLLRGLTILKELVVCLPASAES